MIFFNAEDYLQRLKPISVALDKVQRDNCFMAQAVDAWKQLERDLEDVNQPLTVMKKAQERCSQALTPAHYLAHILDPTIAGNDLSCSEVASVAQTLGAPAQRRSQISLVGGADRIPGGE